MLSENTFFTFTWAPSRNIRIRVPTHFIMRIEISEKYMPVDEKETRSRIAGDSWNSGIFSFRAWLNIGKYSVRKYSPSHAFLFIPIVFELSVDVTSYQEKESTRNIKGASKRRRRFFDVALCELYIQQTLLANHVSSCFSSSNVLANFARDEVRFLACSARSSKHAFFKDSVIVPFIASAKSPEKCVPAYVE